MWYVCQASVPNLEQQLGLNVGQQLGKDGRLPKNVDKPDGLEVDQKFSSEKIESYWENRGNIETSENG